MDTAGNQLPYIDRQFISLVESQEVATLKIAAGEVNMQSRHASIEALPLFMENADKSGFHMTLWPNYDTSAGVFYLNQAYGIGKGAEEADPLIGELMRNRDFRMGLSYALDRKAIFETFFHGIGEIRGAVPTKGTPFYPGDDLAYPDYVMNLDVKKANEILDSIVLKDGSTIKERNSDGMRLRPDNGEVLTLFHDVRAGFLINFMTMAEVAMRNWEELGIKQTGDMTTTAGNKMWDNEAYLFAYTGGDGDPWRGSDLLIPTGWWGFPWPQVGRYYDSGGKEGIDPDQDAFLNPEGENPLTKLLELYEAGKAHAINSPERKTLGQDIYKIHLKEAFILPTVGNTPAAKGIFPTDNHMKNVPELSACCGGLWSDGPRPELYYFDNVGN